MLSVIRNHAEGIDEHPVRSPCGQVQSNNSPSPQYTALVHSVMCGAPKAIGQSSSWCSRARHKSIPEDHSYLSGFGVLFTGPQYHSFDTKINYQKLPQPLTLHLCTYIMHTYSDRYAEDRGWCGGSWTSYMGCRDPNQAIRLGSKCLSSVSVKYC